MDFAFFTPWHRFLPRESGHVVAFSGGRGKRGLIGAVAEVCAAAGLIVVRTGPGDPDPGDAGVVLADADGPHEGLLRLPAPGLVWPRRTSLAVVEVGAGAVGGFVADALAPGLAFRAGMAPTEVLTWELLGDVLLDPARTALPPAAPLVLALTGLQDQPDSIGLFAFTARVMADPRLPIVLFCAGDGDAPTIRACCLAAGSDDTAGTCDRPAR